MPVSRLPLTSPTYAALALEAARGAQRHHLQGASGRATRGNAAGSEAELTAAVIESAGLNPSSLALPRSCSQPAPPAQRMGCGRSSCVGANARRVRVSQALGFTVHALASKHGFPPQAGGFASAQPSLES